MEATKQITILFYFFLYLYNSICWFLDSSLFWEYEDSIINDHHQFIIAQTTAQPRHIMNQVLGVLQELNVRWKKIGHYNMKCLWLHVIQDSESLDANHVADTGTTTMNANTLPTQTTVKFEMQVLYPLFPF